MDILQKVRDALALAEQARQAIAAVTHEVNDGKAAISATDQATLNEMLEKERAESQQAHDNLQAAIDASRAG